MCKMLLSINPQHVENILSGKKQFEFRKVRCRRDVDTIVIYSTFPVMKVVAEVIVEAIIEGDIQTVWKETRKCAGITKSFFLEYYEGKEKAVAYKLGNITEFSEPKTLLDFGVSHPPQSFVYLKPPQSVRKSRKNSHAPTGSG